MEEDVTEVKNVNIKSLFGNNGRHAEEKNQNSSPKKVKICDCDYNM